MAEPFQVPPVSTFVIRFWRERSVAGRRWRGRIEHVQSGESASFPDLGAVLFFSRRFGVMPDEKIWPAREKNA